MSGNGSRNKKRQRLDDDDEDEGEKTDGPTEVDVRGSDELKGLLGGRKYVKAKDLTREILLEYAKRQGAVTVVDLLSVTVQTMGGTELEVKLDESDNTVGSLKQGICDGRGIAIFSQQLLLVSKGGDKAEANVEVKQEPRADGRYRAA